MYSNCILYKTKTLKLLEGFYIPPLVISPGNNAV